MRNCFDGDGYYYIENPWGCPRIEKKIISVCDLFKIFDVYFL